MGVAGPRVTALAAAAVAAAIAWSPAQGRADVVHKSSDGLVDWTRAMMTAKGAAAGDIRAPSPAIARVGAERRATEAARARLRRMAKRLRLATGGLVGSTTGDKAVAARIERAVRRARVLRVDYGSDGSAMAELGLPIESVRLAVRGLGAAPTADAAAPTSVVIDARKLRVQPALGIEIVAGNERYAGPVVFHGKSKRARSDARRGKRTWRVPAKSYAKGAITLAPSQSAKLAAARKAGALVLVVLEAAGKGNR